MTTLSVETCSAEGCGRSYLARGFCRKHYDAWRRRGGDGRLCAIYPCSRSGLAGLGLCSTHYMRLRRHGDPLTVLKRIPPRRLPFAGGVLELAPYAAKFWARVEKTDTCWLWTGHKYVFTFGRNKNQMTPMRYAYALTYGGAPAGKYFSRVCGTDRCVRPDHLRPVSRFDATLSHSPLVHEKRAMTHCKRGHPFDDGNTYISSIGARVCVTCRRFLRRRKAGSTLTFEPPQIRPKRGVTEEPMSDLVRTLLAGLS